MFFQHEIFEDQSPLNESQQEIFNDMSPLSRSMNLENQSSFEQYCDRKLPSLNLSEEENFNDKLDSLQLLKFQDSNIQNLDEINTKYYEQKQHTLFERMFFQNGEISPFSPVNKKRLMNNLRNSNNSVYSNQDEQHNNFIIPSKRNSQLQCQDLFQNQIQNQMELEKNDNFLNHNTYQLQQSLIKLQKVEFSNEQQNQYINQQQQSFDYQPQQIENNINYNQYNQDTLDSQELMYQDNINFSAEKRLRTRAQHQKQIFSNENAKEKKQQPCNCKKSKCLKLYCECFAAGLMCTDECNCCDCSNIEACKDHRNKAIDLLLMKNPQAFVQKTKQTIELIQTSQDTNIEQSIQVRGCNCKKSHCLKKYCECYQAGIKCTDQCKCEGCKNGNCGQSHSHESQDEEALSEEIYSTFDGFYNENQNGSVSRKKIKKYSMDSESKTLSNIDENDYVDTPEKFQEIDQNIKAIRNQLLQQNIQPIEQYSY